MLGVRFLGVLDVFVHNDLYVIPSLGTGGSKWLKILIGLYLDSGYLLTVRNSTAAKTLTSIKTAKNYTDILELEKLVVEQQGNEHAIASMIRIIDGLSLHAANIEKVDVLN